MLNWSGYIIGINLLVVAFCWTFLSSGVILAYRPIQLYEVYPIFVPRAPCLSRPTSGPRGISVLLASFETGMMYECDAIESCTVIYGGSPRAHARRGAHVRYMCFVSIVWGEGVGDEATFNLVQIERFKCRWVVHAQYNKCVAQWFCAGIVNVCIS